MTDISEIVAAIREHGRVTLNFHPDRFLADGRTIAEALNADGVYKSQFETGVSSGGLSARPGGDRDRWEQRMFGHAYDGAANGDRPKYGALNLWNFPDGASPRFGSCHVRLRPAALVRCTFCFGDSHLDPTEVGTIDAFGSVLAALVTTAKITGYAVGAPAADPLPHLRALAVQPVGASAAAAPGRSLDDYIEAQVHGPIELATDAEALVLDPSFRGTESERLLTELAERTGIAVEWHAGFALAADNVPAAFRGPAIPPLAKRIAAERGDPLTAEIIGHTAKATLADPITQQHVKQLWHTLVAFGEPLSQPQ